MKRPVFSIPAVAAAAVVLLAGCSRIEPGAAAGNNDGAPEGYVAVEVDLKIRGVSEYATRAGEGIDDLIDNVNLFWFTDTGDDGIGGTVGIDDNDPLVERRYFEYGTRQKIYLKKNETYYVYAVANLEDAQCPNGNLATYFDDVENFGDLRNKYILNTGRQAEDRTKIVMAAREVATLHLVADPDNGYKISPEIWIERVFAKFSINIYNKVAGQNDKTIVSHVNPVSITGLDFIRGSYLVPRAEDFTAEATGYSGETYFQPGARDLFDNSTLPIVEYNGNWYTKQTFDVYTFENRKGNPAITDVYDRKDEAPEEATCLLISSLISQTAPSDMRGKVLFTWIHAGKGRSAENPKTDDITDFNVDRNAVYHFNIIINGIGDVNIDSRREYLDRMILFELPVAANSIDAHYVDMPSYLTGNAHGMVKIESGTGTLVDGIVPDWSPMGSAESDGDRWLRFSIHDPDAPDYLIGGAPVTWYTPSASTSVYVYIPEEGLTTRRLILHFNENVNPGSTVKCATDANGNIIVGNPPSRTALIKIGFVAGAHTKEEYEAQAALHNDNSFYQSVQQYGLKTIGPLGGYVDGVGFTKLLGVESVEENRVLYFTRPGLAPPPIDAANYVFWQYRTGTAGDTNHAYDGMSATRALYNDYRGNTTPPQRGQANIGTAAGLYNPFTNTNAADYCIRKNRDENGDGVISGTEVKWYLPTPAQMSQLFAWRAAFQYPLNQGAMPLWASSAGTNSKDNNYWTSNDSDSSQAYAMTYNNVISKTEPKAKSERFSVRCVRDIEGEADGMFYYSADGHLVADLSEFLPNLDPNRVNQGESYLRDVNHNTIAPAFLISRWYSNNDGSTTDTPQPSNANNNPCRNYSETGHSAGTWWLPSERELSLIYTYADMMENMMETAYPGAPKPNGSSATFHYFQKDKWHWGLTNVGNNSIFWYIDFATGSSNTLEKQSSAYLRCVRYLNPDNLPQRPKTAGSHRERRSQPQTAIKE